MGRIWLLLLIIIPLVILRIWNWWGGHRRVLSVWNLVIWIARTIIWISSISMRRLVCQLNLRWNCIFGNHRWNVIRPVFFGNSRGS